MEAIMATMSCNNGVLRKSSDGESLKVFSALTAGDASREKPSGFVVKDAARMRKNKS